MASSQFKPQSVWWGGGVGSEDDMCDSHRTEGNDRNRNRTDDDDDDDHERTTREPRPTTEARRRKTEPNRTEP